MKASSWIAACGVLILAATAPLVQGSTAMVTALHLETAGTLSFELTDMKFPELFGALSFAVTDANKSLGHMAGPGVMTLDVAGPTTLYADVFATAQGAANVGLFNLQVSFASAAPVPLPSSGLLLAMILGLMAFPGWRRRLAHMKL